MIHKRESLFISQPGTLACTLHSIKSACTIPVAYSVAAMGLCGRVFWLHAALLVVKCNAECVGSGRVRLQPDTGPGPDLIPLAEPRAGSDIDCFRRCLRINACESGFWGKDTSNCVLFDVLIPPHLQTSDLQSLYFARTGEYLYGGARDNPGESKTLEAMNSMSELCLIQML